MDPNRLYPDTVLMPVPLRHAQRIADLLTDLAAGRAGSADSHAEFVLVAGQGEWTERMVATLVNDFPDYPGVIALFDRCAANPGDWIVKSVIEEECRISPTQFRNELAALSKKTKKIFDRQAPIWPVEWKKEKGLYFYRMDATVAAWWNESRGDRRA